MSDSTSVDTGATIDSLADGGCYQFPSLRFTTPNVFATVAFTSDLVIKAPAPAWTEDFEKFAVHEVNGEAISCVRLADATEKRSGVQRALAEFPELQKVFTTSQAAIVQSRVRGTTLLAMFDDVRKEIRPQWRDYLPAITPVLNDLIGSDLRDHLNWFIANFIFDEETRTLSYVDSKPSFLYPRWGNEKNIDSLRKWFGCA
jgi:hypothetical protein